MTAVETSKMGVLDDWKLPVEDFNEIISANPSLRGILFGYVAEYKLRKQWFSDERVTDLVKYDDHDRRRKGDISFTYRGLEIKVEVKSLQTITVRKEETKHIGKFQCDASDRRSVLLPTGEMLETTCLVVGEFDLLAVNLFAFDREWRFAFARNDALPRSTYSRYTPEQRQLLLATLMRVTWPTEPPFQDEPYALLDQIVEEKMGRTEE